MQSTFWMDRALALAQRGRGQTAPNPQVGAVLTREGRLLGEGWHQGPGQDHAEVAAIKDANQRGNAVRGATLWVTLEPCCHHAPTKRTPACGPRLVAEGISAVYAACPDPNPLVAGNGRKLLEDAGIEFHWGPREQEGLQLIEDFSIWMNLGRPWITVKWAQSMEGVLARSGAAPSWITSAEARAEGHRMRAAHDAVAVGAGTLRVDNPHLDLHQELGTDGQIPLRLIFAGSQPLPADARVFRDAHSDRTWIVARPGTPAAAQAPALVGPRHLLWDGQWNRDFGSALERIGVFRLMVEGGPTLLQSFLRAGWWDRAAIFTAPKILGQGQGLATPPGIDFAQVRWRPVGPDILLEGRRSEGLCSPA